MIKLAKNVLETGNLVIFPTETVYGLGCDATNIEAIKKVYKLHDSVLTSQFFQHLQYLQKYLVTL